MKKFLNIFFVILGVIFFIIILIGVYLFITDPLNLKPLLFNDVPSEITAEQVLSNDTHAMESADDDIDKHPVLNEKQEAVLETFGIDPADVPSQITAEQEACFETTLGDERVAKIKAGDVPTVMDYFKAKGCIE